MNETQTELAAIACAAIMPICIKLSIYEEVPDEYMYKAAVLTILVKQLIPRSLATNGLADGIEQFCKIITARTGQDIIEKLPWRRETETETENNLA